MKSPFPGMDPYVEPHWVDIHTALIGEARRVLNHSLPEGLVARAEERIAIESDDGLSTSIRPDVSVLRSSGTDPHDAVGGIAIKSPYKLVGEIDPIIERFIRITDDAGQLISIIEFLSPTNKRSPGLDVYREKRSEVLTGGVHVVEIDLIRAGNWRTLMRPERCPPEALSVYRAIVRTAGRHPTGYLFPISVRSRMPDVPVPLRVHDTPIPISLQAIFETVYEDGRYDRTIDYSEPLNPPLDEDADWIEKRIAESGRRS